MRKRQTPQGRSQRTGGRPTKSFGMRRSGPPTGNNTGNRRPLKGGGQQGMIYSEFALYWDDPNGGWSADCPFADINLLGPCPTLVSQCPAGKAHIVRYD